MFEVPYGQDPYNAIGKYIRDHINIIEDVIAVIEIDGVETNQLFMVDMDEDGYFIWNSDWYEGEEKVVLMDFFPVSEAINSSVQPEQSIEIQDILEYLDTVLHPIISPEHWNVYSELHDMISMLSSAQPNLQPTCNQLAIDCISRQAAIDAICAVCGNDCDKSEFVYNAPQDEQVILCPEHYVLCKLPSAQPEPQWIPCNDPSDLPKDKRLWITREISDGFFTLREVSDVIWDMTEWSGSVSGVVAYMPYWEPEPYTDRREK